ncbi:MAG: alpha-amylase family glycosyl hydrolase, partial [Candidatus Hodarchaeota archaeon]
DLKERAWKRGIRLASDMVPNHTGIDSKWMKEHPDWFLSIPYSPFPSYSYSGESLSGDSRIGIFIEDHYFSRTDAAVTFKWVNYETNDVKYIYHGNDGTSMPWNDTAQLNYLKPEVREAVIQTILHVARLFPIIRFDAAMTLTRKHFQRLWFPSPGTGGDIPSRAEHGMDKSEFNKMIPKEFWREVVDRINQEAPDTLLLAEAFWLLEGFFVRTLGMHRVYNSAFMNMLRDEDNAKYRSVIKNTLEYDPEILKRFVNFMNNPDEETAVNQFGKGDKYFGVCLLLATMPGLPMFGHGQIEGFNEKYGMEYRRSYWNEEVDEGFIGHHKRIIFPLLKKRHLFAEVSNFYLYDFYTYEGHVNEDVFAYSNRSGNERAMVIYHNKFAKTSGWIKASAAFAVKKEEGSKLVQTTLGEGLSLHNERDYFLIFQDHIQDLEYIRNCREIHEKGLYIELEAYQSFVFLNFREVQDNEWQHFAHLHDFLAGRGVSKLDEALQEYVYQPLHQSFKELVNASLFNDIIIQTKKLNQSVIDEISDKISTNSLPLLKEVAAYGETIFSESEVIKEINHKFLTIINLKKILFSIISAEDQTKLEEYIGRSIPSSNVDWGIILSYLFVHLLGRIIEPINYESLSRSWIDEWGLGRIIERTIQELHDEKLNIDEVVLLVKILTSHQNWYNYQTGENYQAFQIMNVLMTDLEFQSYIQVNRYLDILWFNKEAFERLIKWLFIVAVLNTVSKLIHQSTEYRNDVRIIFELTQQWLWAADKANYQMGKFFTFLKEKSA